MAESKSLIPGLSDEVLERRLKDVRVLVEEAYAGKADLTGATPAEWVVYVEALVAEANDEEGYQFLGQAREIVYHLASLDETDNWLHRAKQIYHLKNDRLSVVETREADEATVVRVDEIKKSLWQWTYPWAEDWKMVCAGVLNMSKESARLLERVWAHYRVQREWSRMDMLKAGRTRLQLALATMESDWEESSDDNELISLLGKGEDAPATWAEVQMHLQDRKEKAGPQRQALTYDGEGIAFWDEDRLVIEYGKLELFEPPEELSKPDLILWRRLSRSLIKAVGGEEKEEGDAKEVLEI